MGLTAVVVFGVQIGRRAVTQMTDLEAAGKALTPVELMSVVDEAVQSELPQPRACCCVHLEECHPGAAR